MNSMTGYGFKEAVVDNTQISVEIRSVNSRFLDLTISLPPYLNPLEQRIRRMVAEKIVRGKVDLTIRVRDSGTPPTVSADPQAAVMYRDAIAEIARALGKSSEDIPLGLIIAQEGVLNISREYDAEAYWKKIEPVFSEVFSLFLQDRAREGENLKRDRRVEVKVIRENNESKMPMIAGVCGAGQAWHAGRVCCILQAVSAFHGTAFPGKSDAEVPGAAGRSC